MPSRVRKFSPTDDDAASFVFDAVAVLVEERGRFVPRIGSLFVNEFFFFRCLLLFSGKATGATTEMAGTVSDIGVHPMDAVSEGGGANGAHFGDASLFSERLA